MRQKKKILHDVIKQSDQDATLRCSYQQCVLSVFSTFTRSRSQASLVWLSFYFIGTAHLNGGVCVSVWLYIIAAWLITLEEYVSAHLRAHRMLSPLAPTPPTFRSHPLLFLVKRRAPLTMESLYTKRKLCLPAISNIRCSPARTHLHTLSLTLSCIHEHKFPEITIYKTWGCSLRYRRSMVPYLLCYPQTSGI